MKLEGPEGAGRGRQGPGGAGWSWEGPGGAGRGQEGPGEAERMGGANAKPFCNPSGREIYI